ncbi:MAG: sel1 repeat family protein [Planctomycetaceae bacterium]|jgi:TPR repeat protein|nr:sel1 repeat family protein [Planctomycetaceae bacterium]
MPTKQQVSFFINRFSVYLTITLLIGVYLTIGCDHTNAQQSKGKTDNTVTVVTDDNIEQFQEKANNGDTDAQVALGQYYRVKKDFGLAIKWFQQAAEKGNAKGQVMYGTCFFIGVVVPQDNKQAFEWFQKAANQGDSGGQWRLAFCYVAGLGTDKNTKKAFELFRKSAEQGDLDGMWNLAIHLDDQGEKEEAVKWYKTAANKGKPEAEWRLGDCYLTGVIVDQKTVLEKDEQTAFEWFKKAANHNSVEGLSHYAMCLYQGTGTKQDRKASVEPFRKAANMGEPVAQFMYGSILLIGEGFGVEKNTEKGLEWIIKSAEQGHPSALNIIEELQQMLDSQQDQPQQEQARIEKYKAINKEFQPTSTTDMKAEINAAIMRDSQQRTEERQRQEEIRQKKSQAEADGREYYGPFF